MAFSGWSVFASPNASLDLRSDMHSVTTFGNNARSTNAKVHASEISSCWDHPSLNSTGKSSELIKSSAFSWTRSRMIEKPCSLLGIHSLSCFTCRFHSGRAWNIGIKPKISDPGRSFQVSGMLSSSTSVENSTSGISTANLLHVNATPSSERQLARKSETRYSSGGLGGGSSGM